jgi:3'-phosphoadenosine 5'-phosphosulfate sulfotransferase (PAPS reductase)/FAD synthetase
MICTAPGRSGSVGTLLSSSGAALIAQALTTYQPACLLALFSGGHDSVVSTHIAAQHPAFRAVVHINTGIGIEQTREYVRQICHDQGWPLIEEHAPDDWYDHNCLTAGMPGGPVQHGIMYQRLKDDQVRRVVRHHQRHRGDTVGLVTGIRQAESDRRMRVHPEPIQRERAQLWINPILSWTATDVSTYMADVGLPRNPVVDHLHRSGECLCGALADPQELDWIAFWYPEVAARIRALEHECFKRQLPYRWGNKSSPPIDVDQPMLPLCADCPTRWDG